MPVSADPLPILVLKRLRNRGSYAFSLETSRLSELFIFLCSRVSSNKKGLKTSTVDYQIIGRGVRRNGHVAYL